LVAGNHPELPAAEDRIHRAYDHRLAGRGGGRAPSAGDQRGAAQREGGRRLPADHRIGAGERRGLQQPARGRPVGPALDLRPERVVPPDPRLQDPPVGGLPVRPGTIPRVTDDLRPDIEAWALANGFEVSSADVTGATPLLRTGALDTTDDAYMGE